MGGEGGGPGWGRSPVGKDAGKVTIGRREKTDGVICIRFSSVCSYGRDCWQLAREVSWCVAVSLRLVRH